MLDRPTFIVIGAQKSATTSLYQWLRAHPDVYLPAQKELEFFSRDDLYARGISYYDQTWFANADPGTVAASGEVSPQYMMVPTVPARIAHYLPRVRLLAILRNPIDRAFSHYAMSFRRGFDQRPFEQAVRELMTRDRALPASIDETNYLVYGLYGRILQRFRRDFPADSLRVFFYEDVVAKPRENLREIYSFIGVAPDFVPDRLDEVHNRRALEKRFPRFESWMLQQEQLKTAIKSIVPRGFLARLLFWFETEFNVRRNSADEPTMDAELRRALAAYYGEDVVELERLCDVRAPWTEFAR